MNQHKELKNNVSWKKKKKHDYPQGHTTYIKSKASSCINISITQSKIHMTLKMEVRQTAQRGSRLQLFYPQWTRALCDYCTLSFTQQITFQGYLGYYWEMYGSQRTFKTLFWLSILIVEATLKTRKQTNAYLWLYIQY